MTAVNCIAMVLTVQGLFNTNHMKYEYERISAKKVTEPSLAQMTESAIRVLEKSENGYFLLVEGKHSHSVDIISC